MPFYEIKSTTMPAHHDVATRVSVQTAVDHIDARINALTDRHDDLVKHTNKLEAHYETLRHRITNNEHDTRNVADRVRALESPANPAPMPTPDTNTRHIRIDPIPNLAGIIFIPDEYYEALHQVQQSLRAGAPILAHGRLKNALDHIKPNSARSYGER